ncbi:pancreatic triacylglycerol lipase-like [Nasonia vitripennis]|uniref:phospholipase A1 n=1 Tax=Nasonia vitripennis TaxID=7425 RepID=A0A7M7H9D3_NASVI|nr:pancreatic triacylglycerol lipase-like [Nasonia vitripennis]
MKSHFVILLATFYYIFLSLEVIEAGKHKEFMDLNDDEICEEDQYTLNESNSTNITRHRKFRTSKSALDCLGLGDQFSEALDWFLKTDSNGTKALKVKFHAISRSNPKRVTLQHGEKFDLSEVDFDITRRTMLIVHGFLSNGDEKWIFDMTKALLKWDDVNLFVVDWSDGANTWNYLKAAVNTRTVGDQIATFFSQLVNASSESNEIDSSKYGPLHFIGHSLGSHICGYASKELKRRESKWLVQRITGLDPAQPCFKNSDKSLKLDNDDAPFVDVIHTNGRVLSKLGLGLPYPVGHVDFYPNGGKLQPGCNLSKISLWQYLPLPIKKISETICSHGRSYLYFIDSIMAEVSSSCTFWALEWDMSYDEVDSILRTKCHSEKCIEMGINAEKYSVNGTYITITGRATPFCMVNKADKKEVKDIIEKVKKKLHCVSNDTESRNQILVIYD